MCFSVIVEASVSVICQVQLDPYFQLDSIEKGVLVGQCWLLIFRVIIKLLASITAF